MPKTDHRRGIAKIREDARDMTLPLSDRIDRTLAADLLQAHDDTGISLDGWPSAKAFVERFLGREVRRNGV